jgi:hypothetical protein
MSSSFGISHFTAIGHVAWKLFCNCKSAPESFDNIHKDLLSFHALVKEAQETVFAKPIPSERGARLKIVGDECCQILDDLDKIVEKYESLGTDTKRKWDRFRWDADDIEKVRSRLTLHVSILNGLIR